MDQLHNSGSLLLRGIPSSKSSSRHNIEWAMAPARQAVVTSARRQPFTVDAGSAPVRAVTFTNGSGMGELIYKAGFRSESWSSMQSEPRPPCMQISAISCPKYLVYPCPAKNTRWISSSRLSSRGSDGEILTALVALAHLTGLRLTSQTLDPVRSLPYVSADQSSLPPPMPGPHTRPFPETSPGGQRETALDAS